MYGQSFFVLSRFCSNESKRTEADLLGGSSPPEAMKMVASDVRIRALGDRLLGST